MSQGQGVKLVWIVDSTIAVVQAHFCLLKPSSYIFVVVNNQRILSQREIPMYREKKN